MKQLHHYESELFCPKCNKQHLDEGEWAKRLHHKHLCLFCNYVWELKEYVFGVSLSELPDDEIGDLRDTW